MHPELTHLEAQLRVRDDLNDFAVRRQHPRRPRPPSRVRVAVASQLVRLAARVADEPAHVLARRV
ncbi:hypothetical protein [Egicoccus sp. AB-alg2]|uniref:hypothetical protein n=1 Tax=Egicoccus sp. AB-alg2 TaxID=3242693 RepID=UPI00359ED82B